MELEAGKKTGERVFKDRIKRLWAKLDEITSQLEALYSRLQRNSFGDP